MGKEEIVVDVLAEKNKIWSYGELVRHLSEETEKNERTVKGWISKSQEHPKVVYEKRGRTARYYHIKWKDKKKEISEKRVEITKEYLQDMIKQKREARGKEGFEYWLKHEIQNCVRHIGINTQGEFLYSEGMHRYVDFPIPVLEENVKNFLNWWYAFPAPILTALLTHPDEEINKMAWKYYDDYKEKKEERFKKEIEKPWWKIW